MNTLAIEQTVLEGRDERRRGVPDSTPDSCPEDRLPRRLHLSLSEIELQTSDPCACEALDLAFKSAAADTVVLLRGESGVGKEVLARTIHAHSRRAAHPLVAVHFTGLSDDLLDDELFGHGPDATGKVAAAEGGTLFLGEIGDVPPGFQRKLLRMLKQGCYEPRGETQPRPVNARILASTNRNLEADVAAGSFLEELLFELSVIEVTLPPLRDRPGDILPMAEEFLRYFARQNGKQVSSLAEAARTAMLRHRWPGNTRELRNAIERGVILAAGTVVDVADLPGKLGGQATSVPPSASSPARRTHH